MLISDDCSRDHTVLKCRNWIDKNQELFDDARIVINDHNLGIVKNYLKAISSVQANNFKILAGDDKYKEFDIYSVYSKLEDSILITHASTFEKKDLKLEQSIDVSFYLLKKMCEKNMLRKLILIDNFICAPEVFVPGKYLRDKKSHDFLKDYKYIEDYPQWIYLIVHRKIKTVVNDVQYVDYRIGDGILYHMLNHMKRKMITLMSAFI